MSDFLLILSACLIGVVEGVTEWLPISSTGHMILVDEILKINQTVSEDFYNFFLVAIQLGAVMAVVVMYFERLNPFSKRKSKAEQKSTWRLWSYVLVGILPATIVGFLLDDWLEAHLYSFLTVALTLIIYGVAYILTEKYKSDSACSVETVYHMSYGKAFLIGCFQVLSLIPGTSRSGSTILGGMLLGTSRTTAAEFSFFMSVPIMLGATLLRGYKYVSAGIVIDTSEMLILLVGTMVAFLISMLTIRFLMNFVRQHSFKLFGWYRIILGIAVLLIAFFE